MLEEISFETWLRKQRRALDLSQKALADQVGCAEVTLRRIEAGTLKPSKELASILLEKLGIPETERPQWISFARGLSGFPLSSTVFLKKLLTNLPAPLTTFIGREKEQPDVIRLIAKHRLVTLTGSGGVGKTRLSLKVAEQILRNYADGVWLVELAAILDPLLVPRTTAIAIGLRDEPQRPVIDMLSDYLREKNIMIILDNCEHLVYACAQMADQLLRAAPNVHILGTSREPLDINGEAIYRVPSLELPDLLQQPDVSRLYEAVSLFEERAKLAQFDFSVTPENATQIIQICRCLDGIPLAIELAAAKVGTLSVEQVMKLLLESLNTLSGGSRTTLPRYQTLRASIDWSWNLLTESEQRLMRQLAVFSGGWTLEAAQAICEGDVLEMANSLAKKSLIVIHREMGHETRYRFHETIRQYAREKALEAGGEEAIRDRHLAYFVKLVEQAEPELYRSNQVSWYKKLDDELDNFRKALEWAWATDVESGLRILAIPWRFWQRRNYQEAGNWLSRLLERYPKSDSLQAQALAVYSNYLFVSGNFDEARKVAEQGLQLARVLTDRQNEALSLLFLGRVIAFPGHFDEGIPLLERSLALYQMLGDKIGQATATGWLSTNHNDLERSKSLLMESLKLHRNLGNLSGIAWCLTYLAFYTIFGGNVASPAPWLEEAITL